MSINPLELLQRVKAALQKRGSRTIAGLGRTFRALDSYDGNRKVDKDEFNVGLRENGVELTQKKNLTSFLNSSIRTEMAALILMSSLLELEENLMMSEEKSH